MTNYVMVGGAWLGGWCWQPVARRLREDGHDAYPVTLTGVGERKHLSSNEIDLETHIADVVNLIEFEDLHEIVLLGHSYAGIVVTGVADRVADRLSRLVYLDSGPVPDGGSFIDMQSPKAKQFIERQTEEFGDGWRLPLPSWEDMENVFEASLGGLDEGHLRLMRERGIAQPLGTYTQPLKLENAARSARLEKTLITSSFPLDQVRELIAGGHPWFRDLAGPEWQLLELTTGHWPMFSRPEDLASLLRDLHSE